MNTSAFTDKAETKEASISPPTLEGLPLYMIHEPITRRNPLKIEVYGKEGEVPCWIMQVSLSGDTIYYEVIMSPEVWVTTGRNPGRRWETPEVYQARQEKQQLKAQAKLDKQQARVNRNLKRLQEEQLKEAKVWPNLPGGITPDGQHLTATDLSAIDKE